MRNKHANKYALLCPSSVLPPLGTAEGGTHNQAGVGGRNKNRQGRIWAGKGCFGLDLPLPTYAFRSGLDILRRSGLGPPLLMLLFFLFSLFLNYPHIFSTFTLPFSSRLWGRRGVLRSCFNLPVLRIPSAKSCALLLRAILDDMARTFAGEGVPLNYKEGKRIEDAWACPLGRDVQQST